MITPTAYLSQMICPAAASWSTHHSKIETVVSGFGQKAQDPDANAILLGKFLSIVDDEIPHEEAGYASVHPHTSHGSAQTPTRSSAVFSGTIHFI